MSQSAFSDDTDAITFLASAREAVRRGLLSSEEYRIVSERYCTPSQRAQFDATTNPAYSEDMIKKITFKIGPAHTFPKGRAQ